VLDVGLLVVRSAAFALEVTEHPLRARFSAVHGDDAKSLWADLLHAGLDYAFGLAQYGWTDRAGFARFTFRNHFNGSPLWEKSVVSFPKTDSWNGSIDFLSKRTTYQGLATHNRTQLQMGR
jgi:hypothetical protein